MTACDKEKFDKAPSVAKLVLLFFFINLTVNIISRQVEQYIHLGQRFYLLILFLHSSHFNVNTGKINYKYQHKRADL